MTDERRIELDSTWRHHSTGDWTVVEVNEAESRVLLRNSEGHARLVRSDYLRRNFQPMTDPQSQREGRTLRLDEVALEQAAFDHLSENPQDGSREVARDLTTANEPTHMTGEIAPRVAVKSHLDGDPKPRPDEIIEWDLMRRTHSLDQMVCLILLPDEAVEDSRFPGYTEHWWAIRERDGKVACEPTEVEIQIVPDGPS